MLEQIKQLHEGWNWEGIAEQLDMKEEFEAITELANGCEYLISQVEELQKALKWYADDDNWKARSRCGNCGHHLEADIDDDAAELDAGQRARTALQSIQGGDNT